MIDENKIPPAPVGKTSRAWRNSQLLKTGKAGETFMILAVERGRIHSLARSYGMRVTTQLTGEWKDDAIVTIRLAHKPKTGG